MTCSRPMKSYPCFSEYKLFLNIMFNWSSISRHFLTCTSYFTSGFLANTMSKHVNVSTSPNSNVFCPSMCISNSFLFRIIWTMWTRVSGFRRYIFLNLMSNNKNYNTTVDWTRYIVNMRVASTKTPPNKVMYNLSIPPREFRFGYTKFPNLSSSKLPRHVYIILISSVRRNGGISTSARFRLARSIRLL